MDIKELKKILEEDYAWGNLDAESNKWFINELLEDFLDILKKQLTLTDVSQQCELLPEFLMEDLDGKIITSVIGSSDVTKEWNKYLGNCA